MNTMNHGDDASADRNGHSLGWLARRLGGELGPLLALLGVVAFFCVFDAIQEGGGGFSTVRNLRVVLVQASTVAVAALGMTLIIIAGGIDLSAGTAIALSATVVAWSLRDRDVPMVRYVALALACVPLALLLLEMVVRRGNLRTLGAMLLVSLLLPIAVVFGSSVVVAIIACILVGGLCGLINGIVISALRIVPFIVTLGTMTIYLGVAKLVADETTVRPKPDQVPQWLNTLVSTRPDNLLYGFPTGVWLALILSLGLAAVLRYSVYGRHVFALGSSESTARLCGIDIARLKISVYTLAGLFIGIAGVYQFARLSVGNPTSGVGLELRVIAAVVIGGGSLSGGQGTVLGTLTGAAIMAVIASGCNALGLSNPLQDIILGVIIVAAVTMDQIRHRQLAN